MPRIPTLDAPSVVNNTTAGQRFSAPDIVQPVAPNGARFNTQAQSIQVDTSRAQLANQANEALGRGMDQFAKIQMEAQERADQVRINEALNQASRARLALTYDPEQGFVHLTGQAALERPDKKSLEDEFGGRFNENLQAIMAGLGNDRQRQIFAAKAAEMDTQFRGDIIKHTAREFTNHAISVNRTTIEDAIGRMGIEFGDPARSEDNKAAIKAATFQEGRIRGWSAKQTEMVMQENLSRGHASAIKFMTDTGMYEMAEEYFKLNGEEMTPQARLAVKAVVEEGSMQVRSQRATDSLFDKHGSDLSSIMAEVREKYEGKERDAIETRVKNRHREEQQIAKEREDSAMEEVMGVIAEGRSPTPYQLASLSGRDRFTVNNHLRSMAEGRPRKTDMQTWLAFADLSPEEKARMSMGDLYRLAGDRLSDADLKAAAKEIASAKEAVKKGDPPGLQVRTVNDEVRDSARRLGIIPDKPDSKLSTQQKEDLARFKDTLQVRISEWEASTGKKANQEAIRQITGEMAVDRVRVEGRLFGSSDAKPFVALSDAEKQRAVVVVDGERIRLSAIPQDYRDRYAVFMMRNNAPVTKEGMVRAWIRDKRPTESSSVSQIPTTTRPTSYVDQIPRD